MARRRERDNWTALVAVLAFAGFGDLLVPAGPPMKPRSGRILTLGQLRTLAELTGFPDPKLAAAIAMAESGGNPDALAVTDREHSVGLWQINLLAHAQYDETMLHDAAYNAKAAFDISQHGANWRPWSTYTNGSYKQFLDGGIA